MPITAFAEGDKIQMDEYLSSIGHIMIASDVMKKPITIKDEDDISTAAQILTERKISGL
jgi:CBS domain-containing protein